MSIVRIGRFVPTLMRDWDQVFRSLNQVINQAADGTVTVEADNLPPQDASYVTLAANTALTNERILAVATGELTQTDNGAGATVALGLADAGTVGTYTKVTTDTKGRVTAGATLDDADIPATIARDSEVAAAVSAHAAEANPHPVYLTQTEGDALYAPIVHSHAVTWYTPASVTKVEGGAATGTVAGVQTMLDGSLYEVVEAAATPGFDLEFAFSGITKTPTEIVVRVLYEGASTHGVAVELWDYTGTPAYDRIHQFTSMLDYQVLYIPLPSWSNYLSGGAAKLRIVHFSAGNAAHDVHVDYVAIRAAT